MAKGIKRFLTKKLLVSSLKVYIISILTIMVMSILVVLELMSLFVDKKLSDKLRICYFENYANASEADFKEFMSRLSFKDVSELSASTAEWYENIVWVMNGMMYVVIILAVVIFGTIMIKRVSKELRKFENALEVVSNSSATEENISLSSDIKEFNSICISYNRMVKRLRDSEEQRHRMEAEQKKMIADISHDIKTPITVIQGYAQAVCDDLVDEATKKKYLDVICQKSDTVAELTNTLHEYSKLEHPNFTLDLKEGDICEYFRSYLATKYQELDVAGFELEAEIPDKKIMYRFDKKQLKRVFENLITNSYRHNEKGTLIYAEMSENDSGIIIRIGDNGKGIPDEMRNNIFDPFVVGSKARTGAKGSGLGLAISKKIVSEHGGTIALISDPDGRLKTLYEINLNK